MQLAIDNPPKLFDKGRLYNPVRQIWVEVEPVRNPVEQDGYLYWHFKYLNSDQVGWGRVMPSDQWEKYEL